MLWPILYHIISNMYRILHTRCNACTQTNNYVVLYEEIHTTHAPMKHIKNALIAITLMLGFTIGAGLVSPVTASAADLSTPTSSDEKYSCEGKSEEQCLQDNPIVKWISFFINLVSVLIVVGAAVMLVVAGIQYSASADNAQGVSAAKKKIMGVVTGLLAYGLMYAFLQWLVPGGVF